MKPSKKPQLVRETMVLPTGAVGWVTVETGKSERTLIVSSGTGKETLLNIKHGKVEIPVLSDKCEDQQLLKES